ncbi:Prefoldin subunit 3 [Trichinella zimbabwensis]|uniref:Prefoldin subunit 3 n=2 Tax=Trichinella TaxID=6333 RepID=A0A0V1MR25_9BILA|nr:Prefoldin subunit 3 [Trichinella zimbabwensis]KRZ74257.1 Prefoldin subunit 3 [Trichinella papuae]
MNNIKAETGIENDGDVENRNSTEEAFSEDIPVAEFIGDVEQFSIKSGLSHQEIIQQATLTLHRYKMIDRHVRQSVERLAEKIVDIKKSLQCCLLLEKKLATSESLVTHVTLADNLFSKVLIPPSNRVCIWLGADVMVEFTVEEGIAFLKGELEIAEPRKDSLLQKLDFIREQMTTVEVNIAMVHNYMVLNRNESSEVEQK